MLASMRKENGAPDSRQPIPPGLLRLASDDRLVAQVRAGSDEAFEVLFDRHHRSLTEFCQRMLRSAEEAEDAVQHTFFSAYCDMLRSEKPIALRPWLYAIARHRCLSVLRARRDRPVGEVPEVVTDSLAAVVDARADLRAALADVARLPEDQRAALVLTEMGDL
jgi:RNA polymerase sigma factor (sigma-70 family)